MSERVLLLQGPSSPFFFKLAQSLQLRGASVWKINFNGGDLFYFFRGNYINYRGCVEDWEKYLRAFVREKHITKMVCYGDCRIYHKIARKIADELKIDIWYFEEGYIRPDYVTLEKGGVNANSRLPWNWKALQTVKKAIPQTKESTLIGSTLYQRILFFFLYDVALSTTRFYFPHYRHHRVAGIMLLWPMWLTLWRWISYSFTEKRIAERICRNYFKKFYLVPLQVHFDCQVTHHSDFDSVEAFMLQVARSFAAHAPKDHLLVFKHHPIDRGFKCYKKYVRSLEESLGLQNRLVYLHDPHLPTMLKASKGVVTINSTVGLSSLHHLIPTKVLGRAFYALPDLVSSCKLDKFWKHCSAVDETKFKLLRAYIILRTQKNGNFYKKMALTAENCAQQICERAEAPSSAPLTVPELSTAS